MEREIQKELEEWELELYCRNRKRMYKTEKNYRDPRKEVMKDYRHGEPETVYGLRLSD